MIPIAGLNSDARHGIFRIYVDAQLVQERRWCRDEGLRALAVIVHDMAVRTAVAHAHRRKWTLEVEDPEECPTHRYVRWGTDPSGMDNPCRIPFMMDPDAIVYGEGHVDFDAIDAAAKRDQAASLN